MQDNTIKYPVKSSLILMSKYIYPTHLWDLLYDSESEKWFIISINNKKIEFENHEYDFWEYASGNNSLITIFNRISKAKNISIDNIIDFYINMFNKYALIFKTYQINYD
jgi:hypothetical protein